MMMTDKQVMSDIAGQYGLPVELVLAIIEVESNGNNWAIRYESAFYTRYVQDAGHKRYFPCSRNTEERARATSWGLMQLMGQTAREEGFEGVYLSELCEPLVGIDVGCRHLQGLAKHFAPLGYGWDAVCAAYNGGKGAVRGRKEFRNPEYPAKVLKTLGGEWPAR